MTDDIEISIPTQFQDDFNSHKAVGIKIPGTDRSHDRRNGDEVSTNLGPGFVSWCIDPKDGTGGIILYIKKLTEKP